MVITQEIFEAFLKCHTKSHLIGRSGATEESAIDLPLKGLEEIYRHNGSVELRAVVADGQLHVGTPPMQAIKRRIHSLIADWVFSNHEEAAFAFSESREASTPQDVLQGFRGVLVSDFYTLLRCGGQAFGAHNLSRRESYIRVVGVLVTKPQHKRWNWKWLKRPRGVLTTRVLPAPRIGLALGGGFARGISHVGVLRVLERENIPLHCITGVSAGAIVAAAYASGATTDEISAIGSAMRFGDVARWSISKLGFAGSERMIAFLRKLLKKWRFEDMRIPLGVIATDLRSGKPVPFRDHGDVTPAIRASCSYPGLFRPFELDGRMYVDGSITIEVPVQLARTMGASHVIAVCIPNQDETFEPTNMFQVVSRSFQILMSQNEEVWRKDSDVVLMPAVGAIPWDGFDNAMRMVEAGERAAEQALPQIREWIGSRQPGSLRRSA
ncbi:MAG: patatin-like phospholipase family protein [Bryobacteraceae bacterium]|jgi:NTE family protein